MPVPVPPFRILLAGADITGRVDIGSVSVDLTENESALMDCTLRAVAGTQDPDGPTFGALALDVDLTGAGWVRVFAGLVISSEPDDRRNLYRIRASTRMQEHFRAMETPEAVAAVLPSCTWSPAVFGDAPDDLWALAQDMMSTDPADYHLTTAGTLERTAWAAKVTADVALSSAHIEAEADLVRSMAPADDQINTVNLAFDYGVTRWKVRSHTVVLDVLGQMGGMTPCTWFRGSSETYGVVDLPWRAEVDSVMQGGAWTVPAGVAYTSPVDVSKVGDMDTQFVQECGGDRLGGGIVYSNLSPTDYPIFTASAVGYRANQCTVTERYEITLTAAAHLAATGATVTMARTGSCTAKAPDGWPPTAAGPQAGWDTDTAGDDYQDQEDEVARLAMLATAYAWGRCRILEGQRAHRLICTTRIQPALTTAQSVSVACWGVTTGPLKVAAVRHTLSPLRTTITLAISRGRGGTDTAWTIPARPDTSDPVTYWEAIDGANTYPEWDDTLELPVHVGSRPAADVNPDPDERGGFLTNARLFPGFSGDPDKIYPEEIRVTRPEIEARASATLDVTVELGLNIAVPNDSLAVTV